MANTIASGLNQEVVLNAALEAFVDGLAPLNAFTTDFSSDIIQGRNNSVQIGYVPAATAAANFAGTYTAQDSTLENRQITIDSHKYVAWHVTDTETANSPVVSLERFGYQKGFQLATAVFSDMLSLVTNANYGAAAFTGAASTFDTDDVIDIKQACDLADMPANMRSMVMSSSYCNALLKDGGISDSSAYGNSAPVQSGILGKLSGFDVYQTNDIPANSENLVGFAAYPSAIVAAMRYLRPQTNSVLTAATPLTDPNTGITMGYRQWYDADTGTNKAILECNYGFAVGEDAALKRITSA